MNNFCFVTTSYCDNCQEPSINDIKAKFNIDSDVSNIFVNFSNEFSPYNHIKIPAIGASRRKDLVYGKIFKLHEFLKKNIEGKYNYVCHFDFSDTVFCRSATEMMNKFISENREFLMCAEKPCWPYFDTVVRWGKPNTRLINDDSKIANFLNSGVIIAKTAILISLLEKLIKICLEVDIDFWDDQGVWQYYYNFVDNSLPIDFKSDYTVCTAFLKDENFIFEDNKIFVRNEWKSQPYIIHDNSSFSANLIHRYKLLI